MQKDYGEIICTAVDEIVKARMQGLEFNITKTCTIIDNSLRKDGKYTVSDGSSRFLALSQETNYAIDDSVLVLIPNGDYNNDKLILSKINKQSTLPHNYISPMSTMVTMTDNVLNNDMYGSVREDSPGELLANGEKDSIVLYQCNKNLNYLKGYSRIGLSANFKSLLSGFDVKDGVYGLLITIQSKAEHQNVQVDCTHVFTLSSKDMAGNPYNFTEFFIQEKVFDISHIENIYKITVSFYQEKNFIDYNDDSLEIERGTIDGKKEACPNNLFVDNIKLVFGFSTVEMQKEIVELYTNDTHTYKYDKDNHKKKLQVHWVHKVDNNNYLPLSNMGDLDSQKYELRWYKYDPSVRHVEKNEEQQYDNYGGTEWRKLDWAANKFEIDYIFEEPYKASELFKVVAIVKNTTNEFFTSNTLKFVNEDEVPDQITLNVAAGLAIQCLDGSAGNYFLYDQNNNIKDSSKGSGYPRTLDVTLGNEIIHNTLFNGAPPDYIEWWIPAEDTMLIVPTDGDDTITDTVFDNIKYRVIHRDTKGHNEEERGVYQLLYSIENKLASKATNNTIRCVVSAQNVEYTAIKELFFGKLGTNGTNLTFLLNFENGVNALEIEGQTSATISAHLYDANGRRVDFTDEQSKNIQWSWYKYSDGNYILLPENNAKSKEEQKQNDLLVGSAIKIELADFVDKTNFSDNYHILQATYQVDTNSPTLTAYLPIPIKAKGVSHMEGAEQIIYNHQGTPSYNTGAYKVFAWEDGELKEATTKWHCKIDISNPDKQWIPQLKPITGTNYVGLSAAPFYIEGECDSVCVSCEYWSQPILIMQSKYDFAMLNEWDEKLTIDEENGTILSTMLGAGKKINNEYYGVLIGDVQGGTGLLSTERHTGVYGLNAGQLSFGFRDDGTAFIGKSGAGQIKFNGNKGIIESASATGMRIDLETGNITAKNFSLKAFDSTENETTLELNSTQPINGYYFKVGDANNYIRFGDNLNIKTDTFSLNTDNLQLNSNLPSNGYYFKVGDENNHIHFGNDLNIKTNNFELNSNLPSNGYYFKVGDENNYIHFDTALDIQTNAFNLNTEKLKLSSDGSNNYYFYIGNTDRFIAYDAKNNLTINVKDLTLKSAGIQLYSNDQENTQTIGSGKDLKNWRIIAGASFGVTSTGALYASNVNISGGRLKIGDTFEVTPEGKVIANDIEATGGTIGGWAILGGSNYYLKSSNNKGDSLYLFGFGDGTATINGEEIRNLAIRVGGSGNCTPALFGIGVDGKLYASNVNLKGEINATSGKFASGCTIGDDTTTHKFSIATVGDNTAIYTGNAQFAGMGTLGVKASEVYLGTDGLSYASKNYATSIRAGSIMMSGQYGSTWMYDTGFYFSTVKYDGKHPGQSSDYRIKWNSIDTAFEVGDCPMLFKSSGTQTIGIRDGCIAFACNNSGYGGAASIDVVNSGQNAYCSLTGLWKYGGSELASKSDLTSLASKSDLISENTIKTWISTAILNHTSMYKHTTS